jgi:hypothetical protein
MQNSRFWRTIAVVCSVGLLYVGHGLHNSGTSTGTDNAFSFFETNTVHAGEMSIWENNGKGGIVRIFTTDETGGHLHVWEMKTPIYSKGEPVGFGVAASIGMPKYLGTVDVPTYHLVPRKVLGEIKGVGNR